LVTSDLPQVQWEAIENLSDLGHKELAISAAKMVAYMPGHHYRYESAEFVLDYERENGSFDEVIQMFVDLAYDFTNKDQEKAIARLVTFAEVEQILPVLVRALQSSDPAGQYRMAGALVLGGMFSIDLKQELASSILEFRIERLQSKTDKFDINRFDFLNKALVFTEERIRGKNKLATSINLILCNELGRKDDAKKIIERINENSQKDNVADLILAQTFIKFGETQSAIKMVLSILNDKSTSTNIALFAIDILENLGTDTISEILFKIGADSEISDTRVKAVNAFMRYQIPELREKIEKLLLTEPEDGNLREALIETINGYPYDTTKEILIHFLQDKSGRVRAAVANALQKFGTEDVVELLIDKLSDDDERVRITANRSLQIIGRPLPAQPLAKLIFDDPSVEVRINATLALKLAPWLDSKQYLLKAIIDPIDIIRESALDLLLEQDERDVIPLLISYSKDIQIPSQYRASIISALATHFGKTYSLLFQELISDPSSEVSIAAIKAVGEIGEMQIVEDLVAVALPEESVEKSVAVIDTLACCQSVTRIKHISEYLNSSNHQVRKSVVSALVFNFDYDIVPIFIDMFSRESDEEVRKSLIEGIFWLAPDESVDILPKALVDEHWVVRETAAHCMGLLGHINHVEHLCCALFDNDIDVRIAATRSLGAIGDHRAIIPLHKAFSHQQLGVRAAAALALGRTGDETAVKEITASILSGRIPGGEGCLAISYIGSSTSITALKTILEYANRHTKLAALNCLARLDPKIVLESQHSPMLTSTLNLEMLALIPLAFHFINEPGMAEQAYSQALRNIIESHHSPSEKSAILMRLIIDSFELGYFGSCTSLLKYLISYDEVGNMVNLGIAYRVMGEFNLASEMYERSMSKPKFFDSSLFNGLGILAYQQQNSILARDYFGKAYKLGISQLQKSGFKNFWFEEHNLHMMLVTLLGLNRGNEALTLLRRSLPILRWQMGVVKELLWDIEQIAKFQPSTPQVAQIVDETQKLYLELSKQNRGPSRSSWVGNF